MRAESSKNKSMESSASASSLNNNRQEVDQSIDRRRVLQRIKNNEKSKTVLHAEV